MKPGAQLHCHRTSWKGRNCYVLGNSLVRLKILMGGGHVAEFRLNSQSGGAGVNPLWVPPWRTIEPYRYRGQIHSKEYGTSVEGKCLSGIAGHSLCLDYFGLPSQEEVKQGLSLHGEAPSAKWTKKGLSISGKRVRLSVAVELPLAGLNFGRAIEIRKGETVAYFHEVVENARRMDHFFNWAQHVTLGPPFLSQKDAIITLSGSKAKSFCHGYDEGKALLASARIFRWPLAPLMQGGLVDLSHPFPTDGLGFVVAVLMDRNREFGFIAATNYKLGLVVAYCFKRRDFPWVTVWEENRAISAPPWKNRTRARGLEFSTTPFPTTRHEAFNLGECFGESTLTHVPALACKTVRYAGFLAHVPSDFGCVKDIDVEHNQFLLHGSKSKRPIAILASGAEDLIE